jgi:hypothetical protein
VQAQVYEGVLEGFCIIVVLLCVVFNTVVLLLLFIIEAIPQYNKRGGETHTAGLGEARRRDEKAVQRHKGFLRTTVLRTHRKHRNKSKSIRALLGYVVR